MPNDHRTIRKNLFIGFGASAVLTVMMVLYDVLGLMALVAETAMGWMLALGIWVVNGVVFAGVQALWDAAGIRDDDDEDDHHGGRRARDLEADHAVVRIPVEKKRGPF